MANVQIPVSFLPVPRLRTPTKPVAEADTRQWFAPVAKPASNKR